MSDTPTRATDKWSLKLRIAKYALGFLVLVMGVLIVVVQFLTLSNVQATTERLLSCTDPKGECYQSGDRRSGAAIRTITESQKQVVTIAAYCSKQPGNITLEQIENCVNEELAR